MQGHHWHGLVVPYDHATLDGRLFVGDETKLTYRKLPFPVIFLNPASRHESTVAGSCNRVVIDSAEGVSVSLLLDLLVIPHPGHWWAQADFSHDFAVEQFSGNTGVFTKAELIAFHLDTSPAWSYMPPIIITDGMWEEARK
jgi:hypothetical protein